MRQLKFTKIRDVQKSHLKQQNHRGERAIALGEELPDRQQEPDMIFSIEDIECCPEEDPFGEPDKDLRESFSMFEKKLEDDEMFHSPVKGEIGTLLGRWLGESAGWAIPIEDWKRIYGDKIQRLWMALPLPQA